MGIKTYPMISLATYPKPKNELRRLRSLYEYHILDTIPEEEYDGITRIAAQICNVPASLITLLDKDRQWFKSHFGVDMKETPREISFCNHTILDPHNLTIVPDMRIDERFANNPLVAGGPQAVFYAGAPLITPDGYVLGSICVLDGKVNMLSDDQQFALKALARQVITKMVLRKKNAELKMQQQRLKIANKNLKSFAHTVSHDMRTPLANISLVTNAMKSRYAAEIDEEGSGCLELIKQSVQEMMVFIDDVLSKSEKAIAVKPVKKTVDSFAVINKVLNMVAAPGDVQIKLNGEFPKVPIDQLQLQQVFQNIITNAIKYNDKAAGIINISCNSDRHFYHFDIADNGAGIEEDSLNKIFKAKQTLNKTDRYGNKGTGRGLATVKNILESTGGKIKVSSVINIGSVFTVSIPKSA